MQSSEPSSLRLRVVLEEVTQELRKTLGDLAEQELAQKIQVEWNARLRSTAGRAWPQEWRVELNPLLLSLENAQAQILRTALHETAHLLACLRHPRKRIQAHGAEWQQACVDLGIPDERATHRLPLPRYTQRKKYRYVCKHCEEVIERARPLRHHSACASCCSAYAQNRYDSRFRLRLVEENSRKV